MWLRDALAFADGSPSIMAKATTYLGSVESDRGNYGTASDLLEEATELSTAAEDPRREAFALSMLGRINLLRNDLDTAARQLDAYILDAQCDLGVQHGHDDTEHWVNAMKSLASRTGMRALTVRSLLHGAALGNDGDAAAAALLG